MTVCFVDYAANVHACLSFLPLMSELEDVFLCTLFRISVFQWLCSSILGGVRLFYFIIGYLDSFILW